MLSIHWTPLMGVVLFSDSETCTKKYKTNQQHMSECLYMTLCNKCVIAHHTTSPMIRVESLPWNLCHRFN